MEADRTCMVNFSENSRSLSALQGILSGCAKPPILVLQLFAGDLLYENPLAAVASITGLKAELVFVLLSPRHLTQATQLIYMLSIDRERPRILVFFEDESPEAAMDLLKAGAEDVLFPPFTEEIVVPWISRQMSEGKSEELLLESLKNKLGLRKMIGKTPAFLNEVSKIPRIALCEANVLITGETGTGKEMFARSIHYLGRRAPKPFVAVSCGAIPSDLFENEFFGHERGAFTGALAAQTGLIREAEGGTLFLDDVDCVPPGSQMKMLRFLQEKEFRPLGSARAQHSDIRIIASTNRDVAEAVAQDAFRRDLFYRLNVIPVTLPPLRERAEDIPLLARHFVLKYSEKLDGEPKDIGLDGLQKLMVYDWPGNIRELENIIESAVIFSNRRLIEAEDISLPGDDTALNELSFNDAKRLAVAQFEKRYIRNALAAHGGNISQSAKAARKNRRAFWELIRKHKIDARHYTPAKH